MRRKCAAAFVRVSDGECCGGDFPGSERHFGIRVRREVPLPRLPTGCYVVRKLAKNKCQLPCCRESHADSGEIALPTRRAARGSAGYPCIAAEHARGPILCILAESVRSRGGQWEYGLVISSAVVTVLQPAHVTNMHQNLAYDLRYINKPSAVKWQLSGAGVGQKAAILLLRYQKTWATFVRFAVFALLQPVHVTNMPRNLVSLCQRVKKPP